MVTRYEAATQVSYATLPIEGYDHFLVSDAHGNVRVWEPPRRDARKVLQAPNPVTGVGFDRAGASLITTASDGLVRQIRLTDGAVTELRGHTGPVGGARLSPDGQLILSYGRDGTVRVWRAATGAAVRVIADHASNVEAAAFIEGGRRAVSIGDDGRLLAWSPDGGEVTQLFARPVPLTALAVLGGGDRVVVQDMAGAIWEVYPGRPAREVRKSDGASVTVLRASSDGRLVAIGTDRGTVTVYDAAQWTLIATADVGAGVRQIAFDPKGRDAIVITEDQRVHALAIGTARTLPWRDLAMPARNVAYAPSGETLAFVCTDGGAWFYDVAGDVWAYALDHPSDTYSGAFSPDGTQFASSDLRGAVTVRDVAATLAAARRR
jgi:WD40 repeat protein